MSVLWAANGEAAGPTNNPFLEWQAYSGPHMGEGSHHANINLVTQTDEGVPPLLGSYMYRHEMVWAGPGSGVGSTFGDRLELNNVRDGGASYFNPPAGMPLSVRQWTEGTDIYIAHAVFFPKLPQHEVTWSEDATGSLPICQWHGADSETALGHPPIGFAKIQYTQAVARYNGKPYSPQLVLSGAGGATWKDPELLKAGVWYRLIWHLHVSANGALGVVDAWVAKGASAPFAQVLSTKGVTLNGAFMFPCQGGPRNEETAKANAEVPPTEIIYHDGMIFCTTKADAEAVFAATGGGVYRVGQILRATTGTWTNAPTSFAYQWQRCDAAGASCANIAGATGSHYTLTSADVGHTIRVVVTATDAAGSASGASAQTGTVTT